MDCKHRLKLTQYPVITLLWKHFKTSCWHNLDEDTNVDDVLTCQTLPAVNKGKNHFWMSSLLNSLSTKMGKFLSMKMKARVKLVLLVFSLVKSKASCKSRELHRYYGSSFKFANKKSRNIFKVKLQGLKVIKIYF